MLKRERREKGEHSEINLKDKSLKMNDFEKYRKELWGNYVRQNQRFNEM